MFSPYFNGRREEMAKYYIGDKPYEDPDYDDSYTGNYFKYNQNWYWKAYKNDRRVWTLNLPPVAPILDFNWNVYLNHWKNNEHFTYGNETFHTQDLRLHINYCFTYRNNQAETTFSSYTRSQMFGNVYVNFGNLTYNLEPGMQERVYAPVDASNMYRGVVSGDYANLFFHPNHYNNLVTKFKYLRYTENASNMFRASNINWGDQNWFETKYAYNYMTLRNTCNMFAYANIAVNNNIGIPTYVNYAADMFNNAVPTSKNKVNVYLGIDSHLDNMKQAMRGFNYLEHFHDGRFEHTVEDYSESFIGCMNLKDVTFYGYEGNDVMIPNSATNCYMMFMNCRNLNKNVEIASANLNNITGMFKINNYTSRFDIWLPGWDTNMMTRSTETNNLIFKSTGNNSIIGVPLNWTLNKVQGIYYNTQYNLYVHYGKASIDLVYANKNDIVFNMLRNGTIKTLRGGV